MESIEWIHYLDMKISALILSRIYGAYPCAPARTSLCFPHDTFLASFLPPSFYALHIRPYIFIVACLTHLFTT